MSQSYQKAFICFLRGFVSKIKAIKWRRRANYCEISSTLQSIDDFFTTSLDNPTGVIKVKRSTFPTASSFIRLRLVLRKYLRAANIFSLFLHLISLANIELGVTSSTEINFKSSSWYNHVLADDWNMRYLLLTLSVNIYALHHQSFSCEILEIQLNRPHYSKSTNSESRIQAGSSESYFMICGWHNFRRFPRFIDNKQKSLDNLRIRDSIRFDICRGMKLTAE